MAVLSSVPAALPGAEKVVRWTQVGNTSVSAGLAGPEGGAVRAVWYSGDGARLLVRTEAGRVFETTDFETWRLNETDPVPAGAEPTGPRLQSIGNRTFSLGTKNLYATENGGRTWLNLTGLNNESVVGGGANTLAVSPKDPLDLVIGNGHGVWRSLDGGLTWHGLNGALPNLPVAKLTAQRSAVLKDGGLVRFEAGAWLRGGKIDLKAGTVSAQRDQTVYSGSAAGKFSVSRDGGKTWLESQQTAPGAVRQLWIDPVRDDVALGVAGNRLFRTVNGGVFWDDVTGSMPAMEVRAVTADASASVIYAATDRGIFTATLSLRDAGPAATGWEALNSGLPASPAVDVIYNVDGTLTAALEGYGIYETAAPHRTQEVRVLSGADLRERPAAPGSLVSVTGAALKSASAGSLAYPVLGNTAFGTQLQVPFEATPGVMTLSMESSGGIWTLPLTVKESAPAVFVDADGAPLLLESGTGLVVDPKTALTAGSRVQILATGLGRVTPEWPTGKEAPAEATPVVQGKVSAFLDGQPVEVLRATLAPGYIGYYMVELQLPAIINRGANDLTLVMNGEKSNAVRIYLEQQ